jgi:glycerol kinase
LQRDIARLGFVISQIKEIEAQGLAADGQQSSTGPARRKRLAAGTGCQFADQPFGGYACPWGAAYIAGLARGLYPEPEALLEKWQPERRFAPQMPANEREERYAGWRRAVAGVLETVS